MSEITQDLIGEQRGRPGGEGKGGAWCHTDSLLRPRGSVWAQRMACPDAEGRGRAGCAPIPKSASSVVSLAAGTTRHGTARRLTGTYSGAVGLDEGEGHRKAVIIGYYCLLLLFVE